VQLINSVDTPSQIQDVLKIAQEERNISCTDLMCMRLCNSRLTPKDALNLLRAESLEIRQFAIQQLDQAEFEEFLCFIPLLVHLVSTDGVSVIIPYLIQKCIQSDCNIQLCSEIYWQLRTNSRKSHYASIYRHAMSLFRRHVKFNTSFAIFDIINSNLKHVGNTTIPTKPYIKNATINCQEIEVKQSATRPLLIPYHYRDGETDKTEYILFKNEDLRKDQIVMTIIKLMDMILKEELQTDFHIITYAVRPTTVNAGFIEIVTDAETIYDIKEKEQFSILNYIIEHNKSEPVQDVKDRFIKSCAAYCVITYLLGIGDRHLDNIMITKKGVLFHIDFGYILGFDPKPIDNSGMRISSDIVEALGGTKSSDYKQFCELCDQIYLCLRRHVNLFVNMLQILVEVSPPIENSVRLTQQILMDEIMKRFIPGEIHQEAKLQLYNRIDNSSTADYRYFVIDFFHYHNKETPKTIKKAFFNTLSTAKNMIKSAIDLVYY